MVYFIDFYEIMRLITLLRMNATPTYVQGFTQPDFDIPDLVLGFEVWEHLPNPVDDLRRLFGKYQRCY